MENYEIGLIFADDKDYTNRLAACETIAEVEAITWPEASK